MDLSNITNNTISTQKNPKKNEENNSAIQTKTGSNNKIKETTEYIAESNKKDNITKQHEPEKKKEKKRTAQFESDKKKNNMKQHEPDLDQNKEKKDDLKYILLWHKSYNIEDFASIEGRAAFSKNLCEEPRCFVTHNR